MERSISRGADVRVSGVAALPAAGFPSVGVDLVLRLVIREGQIVVPTHVLPRNRHRAGQIIVISVRELGAVLDHMVRPFARRIPDAALLEHEAGLMSSGNQIPLLA